MCPCVCMHVEARANTGCLPQLLPVMFKTHHLFEPGAGQFSLTDQWVPEIQVWLSPQHWWWVHTCNAQIFMQVLRDQIHVLILVWKAPYWLSHVWRTRELIKKILNYEQIFWSRKGHGITFKGVLQRSRWEPFKGGCPCFLSPCLLVNVSRGLLNYPRHGPLPPSPHCEICLHASLNIEFGGWLHKNVHPKETCNAWSIPVVYCF